MVFWETGDAAITAANLPRLLTGLRERDGTWGDHSRVPATQTAWYGPTCQLRRALRVLAAGVRRPGRVAGALPVTAESSLA